MMKAKQKKMFFKCSLNLCDRDLSLLYDYLSIQLYGNVGQKADKCHRKPRAIATTTIIKEEKREKRTETITIENMSPQYTKAN